MVIGTIIALVGCGGDDGGNGDNYESAGVGLGSGNNDLTIINESSELLEYEVNFGNLTFTGAPGSYYTREFHCTPSSYPAAVSIRIGTMEVSLDYHIEGQPITVKYAGSNKPLEYSY